MSRFQNFVADAATKRIALCSARLFETALHAVLINQLIRINSGPNILRSCFLRWYIVYSGPCMLSFISPLLVQRYHAFASLEE